MISKYFRRHSKKNGADPSIAPNTSGVPDNDAARLADCSPTLSSPESGKIEPQRPVDTHTDDTCGRNGDAVTELQIASPRVPVATTLMPLEGETVSILKKGGNSATMRDHVYDDSILDAPRKDPCIHEIVLNNKVDGHRTLEDDDNDDDDEENDVDDDGEDNDDDDIVLEEEQQKQQPQNGCASTRPVPIPEPNITSAVPSAFHEFAHLTTTGSPDGSIAMPPFGDNQKAFNATTKTSTGIDMNLRKRYSADCPLMPPPLPQSTSKFVDSQHDRHQTQRRVSDSAIGTSHQRQQTSFSAPSEARQSLLGNMRPSSCAPHPGHCETSLRRSIQHNIWVGVSGGEGDDENEIESEDEYLALTGNTLDEPMTPHSYSSTRLITQSKRRPACGSLPSLSWRAPSSKPASSSPSLHSLARGSSVTTVSPLVPPAADDGRPPRPDDAAAESTPPSRPILWQPSQLPPEPSDLASVNSNGLRPQSFKDDVLECHKAEKHVLSNDQKILNEKYVIFPKWDLGMGSHSKVLLCYNLEDKVYYAMKILDRKKLQRQGIGVACAVHRIKREITVLKKLRHPSIVALVEVIDDPSSRKVYLVLELAEHGEVMSMNNDGAVIPVRGKSTLPEREVVRVMRSILSAVRYAHQQGIAHRDIKPQNILLTAQGDVKLSDFGVSIIVDEASARVKLEGSVAFLPPEILISSEVCVAKRGLVPSQSRSHSTPPVLAPPAASCTGVHDTRTVTSGTSPISAAVVKPIEGTQARPCQAAGTMESPGETMSATPMSHFALPPCRRACSSAAEPHCLSSSTPWCGPTPHHLSNALHSDTATAPVDFFRADVFSIGVTAFVLLMGRLPWRAHDAASQLRAILSDPDPFAAELRRVHAQQNQQPLQRSALPCPSIDISVKAARSFTASSTDVATNWASSSASTLDNKSSRQMTYSSFSSHDERLKCVSSTSLQDSLGILVLPPDPQRDEISAMAIDFVRRCLCIDSMERATVDELYEHPWIQQSVQIGCVAVEKEEAGTCLQHSCEDSAATAAADTSSGVNVLVKDTLCTGNHVTESLGDIASEERHLRSPPPLSTSMEPSIR